MNLAPSGIMAFFNEMEMTLNMQMETSENDQAKISFGGMDRISDVDSNLWFDRIATDPNGFAGVGKGGSTTTTATIAAVIAVVAAIVF